MSAAVTANMIAAFYIIHLSLTMLVAAVLVSRFASGKRSPALNLLLGFACVFLVVPYLNINYYGPPFWMERRVQRQQVISRVEAIGGWSALHTACTALVEQAKTDSDGYFYWRRGATNALPPVMSALQPKLVEVTQGKDAVPLVFIQFFGAWATGARHTPSYSLQVRCGSTPEGYQPGIPHRGNTVVGRSRLLSDSIFEIY